MKSVGLKELLAMLKRFRSRKDFDALKQSCEAAVAERRWATSLMLPQVPHDDLLHGNKPKWAKKQPRYGSLHGLDAEGRIRSIRGDERLTPDGAVFEQLLLHEDDGFWCIYFDADARKRPLGVTWYEMQGDRWVRSLAIGNNGVQEHLLQWEADRLVRYVWRVWESVSVRKPNAKAGAKLREQDAQQTVSSYSYGADGELDRVTSEETWPGIDEPVLDVKYQRLPKGANLKSLLEEAEELLVREIPQTIRAAKVGETVYGLFLQFTGVNTDPGGLAPPMFLPPAALRQRMLAAHANDPAYLWLVPEWQDAPGVVSLACKNAALDEKLQLIFLLTVAQPSKSNYGPVRKMFQRVCARLNAVDWQGILQTTDDFVAFPFDPHGELDPGVDLKASVPVDRLRLLMAHGHVWKLKLK